MTFFSKVKYLCLTYFLVPSKPAISVKARNTSHTSLLIEWKEIPRDFIHGVLLGYRVLFWRFNETRDTYETRQTGPDVHLLHLRDLWIYTKYKIEVLGFTSAGEGSISDEIVVSTDEFSKLYLNSIEKFCLSSHVMFNTFLGPL